jgi:hypothetical protein
VVLEVEAVDGVLGVQPRETKAALDGTAIARLQFQVRQGLQGLRLRFLAAASEII